MNEFRVGDIVEGLDEDANTWIQKYGNTVVSISSDQKYLRFPGWPDNGYVAKGFKVVQTLSLENE